MRGWADAASFVANSASAVGSAIGRSALGALSGSFWSRSAASGFAPLQPLTDPGRKGSVGWKPEFRTGQPSTPRGYSIISSACESSSGDRVRPSALAALRLITSSNLVGCSTGRSAGLAPFRILAA